MAEPVPVLFLLPAFPTGGAERQIAALVAGLDRARFRPVVAAQHALGPVADEIARGGVPVHLLSGVGRVDPGFFGRTLGLVRREAIRVVLTHGFSTGIVGRLAGTLGGARVRILAEHSTGERDMSRSRHVVNRLLAPLVSAVVSVAHGQRDYLVDTKGISPAKIHVIPNGIDFAAYGVADDRAAVRRELGIPADAPVAGMLAVLRPEKDPKTLLMAARFVLDRLPEARFLLVGDGPLAGDLQREVEVLDLKGRVILAGHRSDVARVLSAFDVSVLCSTDVETLPMAFLESMASRLPLVGTRVGGLPELVTPEENGLLVAPRDSQGLATALTRVLGDAQLRRTWGEASRRRVEEDYGVDRMVRRYEELFTSLLRSAGIRTPDPAP